MLTSLWQRFGFSHFTQERSLVSGGEGAFIQRDKESTLINANGSNNLAEVTLPFSWGIWEKRFLVLTLSIIRDSSSFLYKPGLERD